MTPESEEFRQAQADLAVLATAALLTYWRTLDHSQPLAVRRAIEVFLPDVVQTYGSMGATLAADYYESLRDSSPYVRSLYTATVPELGSGIHVAKMQASGRWAISPLFSAEDPSPERALVNLSGVTSRLTLEPARNTIRDNVREDPDAKGWRRVGSGRSCDFCRMLIGRGEVYSEETASFKAHDRCHCMAEPAFDAGDPLRPEQYLATLHTLTPRQRVRVNEAVAGMPPLPELIAA